MTANYFCMLVPKSYWSFVVLARLSLAPLLAVEITAQEKQALAAARQGLPRMVSRL